MVPGVIQMDIFVAVIARGVEDCGAAAIRKEAHYIFVFGNDFIQDDFVACAAFFIDTGDAAARQNIVELVQQHLFPPGIQFVLWIDAVFFGCKCT